LAIKQSSKKGVVAVFAFLDSFFVGDGGNTLLGTTNIIPCDER
jgi:hypothetical protein